MRITFEDRAVAFIDVLGFKALVSRAVSDADVLVQLQGLVDTLDSSIPNLDRSVSPTVPTELLPKHIYISDCIILSAPLMVSLNGWSHYNGLDILVMRVIQLSHILYQAGYLVRGGIAIGKVWHGDSNIVGPAYQEAYLLEQPACMPRIILSDGAATFWKKACNTNRMCIDYDGVFMVNSLFDYYIPGNHPQKIQNAFAQYITMSIANISNPALSDKDRTKWEWFRQLVLTEKHEAMKWSGR